MIKRNIFIGTKIVAIIHLIILVSCSGMGGMTNVAAGFFGAVKKNDYHTAYGLTSYDFQMSISPEDFRKFLKKANLYDIKDAAWTSSEVDNGVGTLDGIITSAGGKEMKVRMMFLKEGENLRILSITRESSGNVESAGKLAMPGIDKIEAIIRQAFYDFAMAVNKADFNDFHSNISQAWQQQTTAPAIQDIFAEFIRKRIDLTVVEDAELVHSQSPYLSGEGVLKSEGKFLAQPWDVNFKLSFVYEFPDWKLFSISVDLR